MKPSPKLTPTPWDALVVLAVAALAAVSALSLLPARSVSGAVTAVVSCNGEELQRFSPADLLNEGGRTYSSNGYTLILSAEEQDGTVGLRVSESTCPTQDCVHTGLITRSGQSIVCLPARLAVRLVGGGTDSGGVDVVIG